MLGVSGMIGTASGDGAAAAAAAAAAAEAQESGGTSGGSGGTTNPGGVGGAGYSEEDRGRMEEEGGGGGGGGSGGGGNRWPRQETMALLKIRSDMDVVFRDSSLKGPLWEQVSRKMAELGFHRNAKKCKEKFENVYKYHKRTKDGRSTKPDGKNYRFYEALEALENTLASGQYQQPRSQAPIMATPMQAIHPNPNLNPNPNPNLNSNPSPSIPAQITVSSTQNATPIAANTPPPPQSFNSFMNSSFPTPSQSVMPQAAPSQPTNPTQISGGQPPSHQALSGSFFSNSTSSSSSTSSDEDIERRHKRKRKWKDYFERLMKDVVEKQEELQKRFLESLEKRERDRMIREEAWRVQEMARINREHDLLVQERSVTAARESALIQFLQKMNDQQSTNSNNPPQVQIPIQLPEIPLPRQAPPQPQPQPQPTPPSVPSPVPISTPAPAPAPAPISTPISTPAPAPTPRSDNGGESYIGTTSSRWPKAEVEALIKLRTNLDTKYQENGPKGPLWEDISAGMRKIGYNRNAKRCKEKWENINKYFKKVKESNKRRPEDSKTCPYFHQLEALYKEKASTGYGTPAKPDNPMVPIMARPEQQWPLPIQAQLQQQQQQQQQQQHQESGMDEHEGDNIDDNDHDDDDDDDGDDDEDDEGSGYEMVTNKPSSVATTVG